VYIRSKPLTYARSVSRISFTILRRLSFTSLFGRDPVSLLLLFLWRGEARWGDGGTRTFRWLAKLLIRAGAGVTSWLSSGVESIEVKLTIENRFSLPWGGVGKEMRRNGKWVREGVTGSSSLEDGSCASPGKLTEEALFGKWFQSSVQVLP
jgi:hypothetical protein